MSLDYCADQYVLALADRSQITAVSRAADKDYSFFADKAADLPRHFGSVDEVLYLRPKIVVQTWGLSERMKSLAEEGGTRVVEAAYGSDPEIIFQNVITIGTSLGQQARARDLVADNRRRLERLRALPRPGLRAAYVTPSGVTAGQGTYVDEILHLAGFDSWAESRGIRGWQLLPLEDLVLDPPDVFVASFFERSEATQSYWSVARHGRLLEMMLETPTVELPGRLLACNGLFLTEAAERIRAQADLIAHEGGNQ
jgi:iron complex transport system substrate-binding protein